MFFALTFGTILLLCGLAIDSGLLFLAKARMGRAVDGATLAAVGNFNAGSTVAGATAQDIRKNVATIMLNFAEANYTDLSYAHTHYGIQDYPIATTATETSSTYTTTTGQPAFTYTYNFNDGTHDANGAFRKYVQVVLTAGTGGQITSATCNARCPVGTYFIGAIAPFFRDLKVSASSVATRNPRLIEIIVDRSSSMLKAGGGAYGLPQAIVQFLDFFDTTSDYIGIVSFGSNARVEMPLTTNFIIAGTNVLFDAYQTNSAGFGVPGLDPEDSNVPTQSADYDPNYAYSGIRRLKFGGNTAADDGMRLGMEQLMANAGFSDPDVVKYIVLFTDGAWNNTRTLLAAPRYTNTVYGPPVGAAFVVSNSGAWNTNTLADSNIIAVPTFCEANQTGPTNLVQSINVNNQFVFDNYVNLHTNDVWQSYDGHYEPLVNGGNNGNLQALAALTGTSLAFSNNSVMGVTGTGGTIYTRSIDVWLQPGAVDYEYTNGVSTPIATYVSDLTNPTNHFLIQQLNGQYNVLVVPGYVADGLFFDGLDLSTTCRTSAPYPYYRWNNFQEYGMWTDDTVPWGTLAQESAYTTGNSLERQLMFRNFPNLLTGFYIARPDDPDGPSTDIDTYAITSPLSLRHSNGLGPYYPGAAVYWPFDMVGIDYSPNYSLTNGNIDPDMNGSNGGNGGSRHASYSINMLSTNATPRWSGELFYEGTGGTSSLSSPGNTALSTLMSSKTQWQNGAPAWLLNDFNASGEQVMTNESAHNTTVLPTADVWRPNSFIGTYVDTTNSFKTAASIVAAHPSATGGYVVDGSGNVFKDSMAYSGRPTHYFDFSRSTWVAVTDNHVKNVQALPLGNWKVQEYAWHARNMGVTIYTVGYGYLVSTAQQVILAQVANATNTTAGNVQGGSGASFYYTDTGGTAITYNPNQPIGQQFFATNSDQISNDFYQVGQAINAALTQ